MLSFITNTDDEQSQKTLSLYLPGKELITVHTGQKQIETANTFKSVQELKYWRGGGSNLHIHAHISMRLHVLKRNSVLFIFSWFAVKLEPLMWLMIRGETSAPELFFFPRLLLVWTVLWNDWLTVRKTSWGESWTMFNSLWTHQVTVCSVLMPPLLFSVLISRFSVSMWFSVDCHRNDELQSSRRIPPDGGCQRHEDVLKLLLRGIHCEWKMLIKRMLHRQNAPLLLQYCSTNNP